MKNFTLILFLMIGLHAYAQQKQVQVERDIISIEQLQQAANNFAGQRWGNVDPADPIPYYAPSGNIIAYGFNYAIDKEFPEHGRPQFLNESEADTDGVSKNMRWGVNEYAHLIMGNNINRTALVRFIAAMSDEYAYYDEVREMAATALPVKTSPVLDKIYFLTPMLKYYKFDAGSESVYVRIFPPAKVLSEEEFQAEYVDNFNIDEVLPLGTKESWDYYLSTATQKSVQSATYILYQAECVPFLDWSYGCGPTAGAMLLDYWDNLSEYSGSNYGNLTKYHFHRYDPVQGDEDYNVTSAQLKCGTEMGVNASGGISDAVLGSGCVSAANSFACGSYNFTQNTTHYGTGVNITKWNHQIGEINAGRPWLCATTGHATTAIGYEIYGSTSFMILHNTWYPPNDWWDYTLCYKVYDIYPGGGYGAHIGVLTPNGDPGYNHNGNGEILYSGNMYEITWDYDSYGGSYCKLYYSTDAGTYYTSITANTPNDGSFLWSVPSGLSSTEGRIKIEVYSSTNTLMGSDASWGNFKFMTGGSIVTLSSDVAVTTSTDPTYYQISNSNNYWGVVGLRLNNSTDNWSLKMYSNNTFTDVAATSGFNAEVDFIVFDQNHLSTATKGVECYRVSGTGTARTEYEGGTQTLYVGTPVTHSWPAGDVVEIWDTYLAPGTYKISMDYNSGTANLDMGLFASTSGNYYKNREQYVGRSYQTGVTNEYFYATITTGDRYGLVVWANDANSANITINIATTTAGLWEGDVSTNWNFAGNWNNNTVPTSTTDVVIPSGTTYNPYLYAAIANAKSLTVQNGATLTVGAYNLIVAEDIHIYGTLAMNSATDLYCGGSMFWESGSSANISNGSAEMYITGDWNFENGANVQLNMGYVEFTGTTGSWIRCYSDNSWFWNLRSNKSNNWITVSNLCNKDLLIKSNLYNYSASLFLGYTSESIIVSGGFNNMGGHFQFSHGTFVFNGNPTIAIKPNSGDFFNNLKVNVSTELNIDATYNDTLVITGNLDILSGSLKSNSHTIALGGNWNNLVGPLGFYESLGTVVFNGTGTYQFCYGENFYNVKKTTAAANLHFEGSTNISNKFDLYSSTWANDYIDIGTLYLWGTSAKFTSNFGGDANISNLDMGYTLLSNSYYGTIVANGGSITVDDLTENGLFGTFRVIGSDGLLDITQDASGYVDLNGSIEVLGGVMNVHGGNGASYWSYGGNANITMSDGVLQFDNGINIYNSSSYSFTEVITGGTIRTAGSFSINRTFNPTAGTVEFYGNTIAYGNMIAGCSLNDVLINKTSASVNLSASTFTIAGDLTIQSGTMTPSTTFNVGGNWTNNVGASGFIEGTGTVVFYGPYKGQVLTNETFYNLTLNKTYPGFDGLELMDNLTLTVLNNLETIDGVLEMSQNSTLDINGDLIIGANSGLNVNDGNTTVYLAHDFTDNNASANSFTGYTADNTNTLVIDGSSSQYFNTLATQETLGKLTINKSGGTFYAYDNLKVMGDFNLLSGTWDDGVSGLSHTFGSSGGDFYKASTANWYDYTSTINFEGIYALQDFTFNGSGYFGDVVVNYTNANYGLQMMTNMLILGNHDLTIENGNLFTNGHVLRVVGNININSGGTLDMDDDSELVIGGSGHLNINSGGVFEAIGSEGHLAVIESNDLSYWQFNCFSGGEVSAEWASFEDVDASGVHIYAGGIIDTINTFNHCTFLPGEAGGTLLWVDNSQTLTISYASFLSQGISSSNIKKSVNSGYLEMRNYIGSFAGEDFDNDPYNKIHWHINILSITYLNPTCYGNNSGYITVNPSEGTTPYSFIWSNGATSNHITGLSPGAYYLTITDYYGAQRTYDRILIEPDELIITGIVTDVSCFGGSDGAIDVTVSGGTPNYWHYWSNGGISEDKINISAGTYTLTVTDLHACMATNTWVVNQPVSPIAMSFTSININCNGGSNGSIDLTASGGTSPYTYLWNGGATTQDRSNLTAGTYTVTVTDFNGCTSTGSRTISQPASALALSFTSVNVSCNGGSNGSIDLTVTGGTSPYIYLWNGGATTQDRSNLSAGTYLITITDFNGCTSTGTYTITQPTSIYLTGPVTHVTYLGGSNGSIAASAVGGTSPYSFSWAGGQTTSTISGLSAGTYSLTVIDNNGCDKSHNYIVQDGTGTTLTVSGVVSHVNCFMQSNGAIDITATGGTPGYSYLWNDGSTLGDRSGLAAGIYNLTVSDAMASTTTGSWTITQPSELLVSVMVYNASCFGGNDGEVNVYPSGGISPYFYLWNTGYTGQYLTGVAAGNYAVTITDANGCTQMLSYTVSQPMSIAITYIKTDVSTNGGSDGTIDLSVSGGTPAYIYQWSSGATTQDLSGLSAGFFDVTISDSNGCTAFETIEITEPAGFDVQNITLAAGWGLMSTYISPVYPLVDSVFSAINSSTAIVKNGAGGVYWPTFNLNMIGNMILGEGYQVKMNSSQTLSVMGTAVVPQLTPITIQAGWSIIAYLRQVPGNAIVMMSPIVSNTAILKNGGGSVYWPAFGVNSIGNMLPGQGYQIKMNAISTLTYPANSVSSKSDIEPMHPVFYKQPAATGNNMTVGIPSSAFVNLPRIGDEVGVFNSQGQLVGSVVFDGGNLAIPIWGDDDLTPETDGLTYSQGFELRIWNGQSEQGITIESWTEGDGLYERDAIQIAEKVSFTNIDALVYSLEQNVPNPYGATTRISFYLPETSNITLTIYDVLGNVMNVAAKGEFQAGQHSLELDGSQYAMGTYFYRLIANGFVCTKQMEIGR